MPRLLSLLSLCFALVGPTLTTASDLVRLTDRDDLLGWEAVGRVDLGSGYCTGTLISTTLVLTAAHCLFDQEGQPRAPEGIHFRAGLRDGSSVAQRGVTRYAVADGYNPFRGTTIENVRTDAALLELETAIPAATASPFVVHERPFKGEPISVVSYGQNRDLALSWQRECNVLGQGQQLVAFDCNVTFGSSGAPVFTDGGRRARIVSLVVAGRKNSDGSTTAFGMYLPPVLKALKQKLRATPRTFPQSSGKRHNSAETALFPPNGTGTRVTPGAHPGAKFAKPE